MATQLILAWQLIHSFSSKTKNKNIVIASFARFVINGTVESRYSPTSPTIDYAQLVTSFDTIPLVTHIFFVIKLC